MHERYIEQVRLLMRALPSIAEEKVFALKGGSAINLFYRNMPRLSVDIDLAYLPVEDRETSLRNIDEALDRILALPEPPTVICCGNDEMAMQLYGLLRTRGIRVPEDISIAGFDNYRAIAETLYPPLSTVELPYAEMGRQAAELLLSMISEEASRPHDPVRVAGRVFWRSSVTDLELESQTSKGG